MFIEMDYPFSQREGDSTESKGNIDIKSTKNTTERKMSHRRSKSLGSQSPPPKFPELVHDIAYLLIIKKEIIYRIPLILDVTRVEESIRDKNDPNERNQTLPETNENEFCVMLTSNAAKNIEISIKKTFGRCDWLKIVEKCPVPPQVKKGLKVNPNMTKDNTDSKRRLDRAEPNQPSKRPLTHYPKCASNGHPMIILNSSDPTPTSESNRVSSIQLLNKQASQSNSSVDPNRPKTPSDRIQQPITWTEKQSRQVLARNLKPTAQQSVKPNQNSKVMFRNSISEIYADHKRLGYALLQNPKGPTTIDLTEIGDKSRLSTSSDFTSQSPLLFPLNPGIPSAISASFPIFKAQYQLYQPQQPSNRPTNEWNFGIPLSFSKCPPSDITESTELPMDLSNASSSRNPTPMDFQESDVINLTKPKKSMFQQESIALNGGRCWKCDLCDQSFETEWNLYEHYGSKTHVCKSLESVDDSESLQKRIKSREAVSEAHNKLRQAGTPAKRKA
nr:zinc finger C2H2 type [Hymenolepis microstoma]